jgi:hypothetical protein
MNTKKLATQSLFTPQLIDQIDIIPDTNQPRSYYDSEGLLELTASI